MTFVEVLRLDRLKTYPPLRGEKETHLMRNPLKNSIKISDSVSCALNFTYLLMAGVVRDTVQPNWAENGFTSFSVIPGPIRTWVPDGWTDEIVTERKLIVESRGLKICEIVLLHEHSFAFGGWYVDEVTYSDVEHRSSGLEKQGFRLGELHRLTDVCRLNPIKEICT